MTEAKKTKRPTARADTVNTMIAYPRSAEAALEDLKDAMRADPDLVGVRISHLYALRRCLLVGLRELARGYGFQVDLRSAS